MAITRNSRLLSSLTRFDYDNYRNKLESLVVTAGQSRETRRKYYIMIESAAVIPLSRLQTGLGLLWLVNVAKA